MLLITSGKVVHFCLFMPYFIKSSLTCLRCCSVMLDSTALAKESIHLLPVITLLKCSQLFLRGHFFTKTIFLLYVRTDLVVCPQK